MAYITALGTATHTPGPWSVPHFARPDVNCKCGYVLCNHLFGAVATVHCSGEGDDWRATGDNPKFGEAVANAHLIAAAPDLLDALVSLVHWLDIEGTEVAFHLAAAAEAAISKAVGNHDA